MATFTVCVLYAIETEEKKEYAVAEMIYPDYQQEIEFDTAQ